MNQVLAESQRMICAASVYQRRSTRACHISKIYRGLKLAFWVVGEMLLSGTSSVPAREDAKS